VNPAASEQRRQKGNLVRLGTVSQLDLAAARCRVQSGEITTDWIPWLVPRAGNTIEWSAPAEGEQVLVLCPDGDTTGAVAMRGVYSDSFAAPASEQHRHLVRFPDGTELDYDDQAHALKVTLAVGGTAEITAPGGVTVHADVVINGDVQVNGTVTASEDVLANGISLVEHVHGGVDSGTSTTQEPQ
jgi:phage baseplate assembly protein V